MQRQPIFAAAAVLLILFTATQSHAGFIVGSTVNASITGLNPDFSGSATLVDPGVEFSPTVDESFFGTGVRAIVDLTSTTVRVGVVATGGGSASSRTINFSLTGLVLQPGEFITGLTVLSNNRNTGTASVSYATGQFTFSSTANSISVQLQAFALGSLATSGDFDDSITFGVQTNQSVPEPASLAMVGLGLSAVGLVARRRLRG